MSLAPDPVGYLKSWAEELTSQASRIRQLIGDKHWPSDGRHKELILATFLKRYLPTYLVLGTGFITSQRTNETCSREIDIIINDPSIEPAWLHESGIVITPPAPVLAQLQVKSEFSAKTVSDILEGFGSSASMFSEGDCWFGGFFYNFDDKTVESVAGTLKTKMGALFAGANPLFLQTPICIGCLSGALFLVDAKNDEGRKLRIYSLRIFNLGHLSPAVFFAHLLQHLAKSHGQHKMLELTRYVKTLEDSLLESLTFECPIE